MEREDNVLDELLIEIARLTQACPKALEQRAAVIHAGGKDPELAEKLIKAADNMRDSGNLYLTWAKHYKGRRRLSAVPAADAVLSAIKRSKQGLKFVDIQAKTGFVDKKIRNIIFRLNKLGKIKRHSRGVYVAI